MMGRKFEEGDWSYVYCNAKNIPHRGWSNLNIDVMHKGLGVEHKMLCRPSNIRLSDLCGTRLMHPAATRSIRIPSIDGDPNEVMNEVLTQYAQLIEQRRKKIREDSPGSKPDLRTGWLLWQESLREFLYFEEEMLAPNPQDYMAEWRDSGGGSRKVSRNLWVYEKETGQKKFSVTTSAGAKIQPYFDVPPPSDPNLYIFTVQGEELSNGLVRIWVTTSTERELRRIVGDLTAGNLDRVIAGMAKEPVSGDLLHKFQWEEAKPLILSMKSYKLMNSLFPDLSDEHMVQLLIQYLTKK